MEWWLSLHEVITMLVDLSKEELRILCEFISNNAVHKDIDPIYDKLKNISNACTCKED